MDAWKEVEKQIVLRDGKINVIESCVDRHAEKNPEKLAFVFENNGRILRYTYKKLQAETNKFANLLNNLKVRKNSRIFIFLPKVPEMYISFLGAIKQGSIAVPLFEAFQTEGLKLRLNRGDANVLVTNNELLPRIPKNIKKLVPSLQNILVIDSQKYKRQIKNSDSKFKTVLRNKKDSSIILFTSSTAGTPVAGIQLPHYGIVQQHMTAKLVLDLKESDNYWCTAHPGWVTGSIYGILAPLSVGCTNYVFGGHFEAEKWIEFIKKNNISVIYTAPTALRMLKSSIIKRDLKNVRNICSVGEALTDAIFNHYKKLGVEINDTYWQTETGAIVIATWPELKKKTGSLGKAIPGIEADVRNKVIVLKPGWPAMMTGIYKHNKMYKGYFKRGWFQTNDNARKDKEGYFFFEGRGDDIIKTSGMRVSPIEIESILLKHKSVREVAVIGIPDKIKGYIIKAFIVLEKNAEPSEKLKEELILSVKKNYAGHAYPKEIQFMSSLPKTNSGKIIRMELRKLSE
jgi:acetyl-CoA synthetase